MIQDSQYEKIEASKKASSMWNKSQHRNNRVIIEAKKEQLEAALTNEANDTELIKKISTDLKAAYLAEEVYGKQISWLLWLKLGDRNSGFFNSVTKGRRRANMLTMIEDEHGNPIHKEEKIAQVSVSYFGNFFASTTTNSIETINYAIDPIITQEQNDLLIIIPLAEKIKAVALSIHTDKAPDPNGFSAGFYYSSWDLVGASISKEIQQLFASGTLPERINDTHIRLIPKVHRPHTIKEYNR
ncbi:hypothetical protein N665_2094s0001 [Sinapis alba]|nr:hypothetical protein N665_2094s0001 [Sinapis alba]